MKDTVPKANSVLKRNYNNGLIHIENHNGCAYFFQYETKKNEPRLRLPDGSIELAFLLKEEPLLYLTGPVECMKEVRFPEDCTVFGIVFLPSRIPGPWMKEFKFSDSMNQSMLIDHTKFPEFKGIFETKDFDQQIEIALDVFSKYDYSINNLVQKIMAEIYNNRGNIQLNELYKELGYSRQYINQLFKNEIGLSPKYFCKVLRFQYLIYCIATRYPKDRLHILAKETGFYDQSHMNKEFKEFTNHSPDYFVKNYYYLLQSKR